MNRVYYYVDELNDDFAGTHITAKKLPPDYKYVPQGRGWKAARFFVYKLFATPIIMLAGAVSVRYKNKRVLRGCKKGGAFIYGNHTAYFTDALNPTNIAFPRTADVVVNADAVSIRGIGGLVRLLGAVPVPQELCGLKNFSSDIVRAAEGGHWVAIYPEAHIWPYYTGIRPFGAASFKYPAKCGLPVFAYTTVYKKRRLLKRPKKVVYIDGPFFAEGGSVNERAHALRDKVYAAMCERAKLSDCAYCEYIRADDARLAAALNAERGRARCNGGGIGMRGVEAESLTFYAKNGDIRGSISGDVLQYAVQIDIKKGDCNLAESGRGERSLSLECNNGDIHIIFEG